LQLGPAEARLAAVWALTMVFLAILGLLLLTGLLSLTYAVASAGHGFDPANPATWARAVTGRGRLVIGAAIVIGTVALAWAAVRVSLAEAASVAGDAVQVLSAWRLTRGRALTIACGNLLLAIIPAAAFLLVPAPLAGADWPRPLAFGLGLAGAWLPLQVGLMAYVYQRHAAPGA
jgi:hypothetical protein